MIPTIFEQTGWKGSTGVELCQDFEVLQKITQYDYNYHSEKFIEYCTSRGILHRILDIEFCADHTLTKEDYLKQSHPAIYLELSKKQYEFSVEEIKQFWKLNVAARGVLQDCWEIYTMRR